MEKVGFIGLGTMGTPMATNIHEAGYPLHVYNRSPQRTEPFRALGVPVCTSARELAERADVVITMVTDPHALDSVLDGPDGALKGMAPGKILINMSTVSVDATTSAAERVTASGGAFIDAPVSGSVKPAQEGTLVILASGDSEPLERATPILKVLGKELVRCGPAGQGTRMKLVLNLMLGNMMQALAEALILGRNFSLDTATILNALGNGPMSAPLYQMKGKIIADQNYASQFPVRLMFKDLNLVLEAAAESCVPLPQTAATRECFKAAMGQGMGNEDMAAVTRVLERFAGQTGG